MHDPLPVDLLGDPRVALVQELNGLAGGQPAGFGVQLASEGGGDALLQVHKGSKVGTLL